MRILKQVCLLIALGALVVAMGQACGQPMPTGSATNSSSGGSRSPTPRPSGTPDLSFCTPGSTIPICQNQPGSSPTPVPNQYGVANTVTVLGGVSGEARNPANSGQAVVVYFFVDGAQGMGMAAGQTTANLANTGNQGGNNRFSFTLPTQFRNGQAHALYAYAFINGVYQQLANSPQSYTAYTPKASAYYESTVRPQLQTRCAACHSVTYDAHFANLVYPSKAQGGTAANNELINRASGQNSHGGGTFCATKNDSPCSLIQNWWNMEFN